MPKLSEGEIEAIKKEILNCTKCKLHERRNTVVLGDWNIDAKVMFIGIAPGRLGGDITGIAFTKDRSGKLLRNLLEEIDLSPDDVDITNLVRCNPKDEKSNNRKPSRFEITICSTYLDKEIEAVSPSVIVPLGKVPMEYVLGEKIAHMSDYHGKVFRKGDKIVLPLYHPSYVANYAGYSKERYIDDFGKIGNLLSKNRQVIRS